MGTRTESKYASKFLAVSGTVLVWISFQGIVQELV